jgi:hypothetical protein
MKASRLLVMTTLTLVATAGLLGSASLAAAAPPTSATDCLHGSAKVAVHQHSLDICAVVGTRLKVNFSKHHEGYGRAGPWDPSPHSYDSSVIKIISAKARGPILATRMEALAPGSTSVMVVFSNECAPWYSPPCTIPPQSTMYLDVTVVK